VNPVDCIIHDPRVAHGAPGNRSRDVRRRAIAVRYAGDDTKDRELAVASAARSYGYNSRIAGAGYPRVWPTADS
jgi:ectoine hydroxylase-related dioxygenase (phytanoyl-CoA dioxygenase family)